MDTELLRTFLEVNNTRHFGKAADALHLTQAAVSARIKLLERSLGVSLFDRIKRDITLTPEGHKMVHYADMILSGWRKARQDLTLGGASQQLTIGGSIRLWDIALQDWLVSLRTKAPDLAIIAESHTPTLLTRRLLDGLLDVAFMLEPSKLEVLQVKKIATVQLQLVTSKPNQTVSSALNKQFIMVDWGLAHALTHRRQFPDAPEAHIRVGQAKIAVHHLHQLGGSAYLPASMIANAVSAGQLYLVNNAPTFELEAFAVYPIRSAKAPLINQALKLFNNDISIKK